MPPSDRTAMPHWDQPDMREDALTRLGDRVCAMTSAALLLVYAGSLAARWLGI